MDVQKILKENSRRSQGTETKTLHSKRKVNLFKTISTTNKKQTRKMNS